MRMKSVYHSRALKITIKADKMALLSNLGKGIDTEDKTKVCRGKDTLKDKKSKCTEGNRHKNRKKGVQRKQKKVYRENIKKTKGVQM